MKLRDLLFIFIVLFVIPQAAISHHSASILFNMEKMISIEGIVTEVWFQNPHSRYYVEKSTENGLLEEVGMKIPSRQEIKLEQKVILLRMDQTG